MSRLRLALLAAVVPAAAIAAVLWPLWTYALTLALFGLPHVLVELRYVDERFAARLPRRFATFLVGGLGAVVLLRMCALGDVGTSVGRATLELLCGAVLVASAALLMARVRALPGAVGAAVLVGGALVDPAATLVGLAILHNLTPVAFLAERLRGRARRRALFAAAVAFGVVPALLLLVDLPATTTSGPFDTGALDAHLPAFVPLPLLGGPFADRLFTVATYLQCLHYAAVLHVLPVLGGAAETKGRFLSWPGVSHFRVAIVAVTTVLFAGFVWHFAGARSVYSVFAALHSWLELPLLALACGCGPVHTTQRAASEAA